MLPNMLIKRRGNRMKKNSNILDRHKSRRSRFAIPSAIGISLGRPRIVYALPIGDLSAMRAVAESLSSRPVRVRKTSSKLSEVYLVLSA